MRTCQRLLLIGLLAAIAVAATAQENRQPRVELNGKVLFEDFAGCASCHGLDGRGEVPGRELDPPPPDFTDCKFNNREPRRDWHAVIERGGPIRGLSWAMPEYGPVLSEAQIDALIDYIKTFCGEPGWASGEVNFRRAQVTTKAFPEDELLILPRFTDGRSNTFDLVAKYERRFGKRSHFEVGIPFRSRSSPAAATGLADMEIGGKTVIWQNPAARALFTIGGEIGIPTGRSPLGLGTGGWTVAPFAAMGKGFTGFNIQSSAKLESKRSNGATASELLLSIAGTVPLTREKKGFYPTVEMSYLAGLSAGGENTLFVIPQVYFAPISKGHIAISIGAQTPIAGEKPYDVRLLMFLLWEYADGGIWW